MPDYFDFLIRDFRAGHLTRHVHLGQWDLDADPDGTTTDFGSAQARLDESILHLAAIEDGMSVVDVGCGFGGTIERIDARVVEGDLVGVNVDGRQLAICAELDGTGHNRLGWVAADAVDLPFRGQSVDRVLCIEAMPHFASRAAFFSEAARLLRPGGRLVVTDILVRPGAAHRVGMSDVQLDATFDQGLGPWPEPVATVSEVLDAAALVGLELLESVNATAETVPSHRYTAPDVVLPPGDTREGYLRGARLLATLHAHDLVVYPYLSFVRA